jgi:GNAT superfamily N-acetyltransferase
MIIRYLKPSDLEAVNEFISIYKANYDWRVNIDTDWLIESAEEEDSYFLGAFIDNSLVGVVSIGGADDIIDGTNYTDALISDVYVIPEMRSQGIAHELIISAIQAAQDQYGGNIYVTILDDDLEYYYNRFGFTTVEPGLMMLTPEDYL